MTTYKAIQELNYNWLISNESDPIIKQQLIEMYFESIKIDDESKSWNNRQWSEYIKKIFRRYDV